MGRVAGLDVDTRARLLHHADSHTVARYDHALPGELDDALARVQAAMRS